MNLRCRFVVGMTASLFSLLLPIAAAQPSSDDSELELGAKAYKQARYEEAIQHFEKAVEREPSNVRARLYLATACAQQYIPGVDTPENLQLGEKAVGHFRQVLDLDPVNVDAVKGLAYLYFQMKKLDDAKEYHRRVTNLEPKNPEAHYSIGVIDWTQAYQPRQELRAKLHLRPDEPLIQHPECWQVRETNQGVVSDGIEILEKALELRPNYDDAMAYMNLLYRERADIQCYDEKAHAADLAMADKWVDLTMAARKAKAERQPGQSRSDRR